MKKIILLMLLSFSGYLVAQTDCAHPVPFCTPGGSVLLAPGNTVGAGPSYGCLSSPVSAYWMYTRITTAGNIDLQLSSSVDFSIICWGPFPGTGFCANISAANIVACDDNATSTKTLSIPSATVGAYYAFMFSTQTPQTVNITQVGGTGQGCGTNCNEFVPPAVCYVNADDNVHNSVYFNHDMNAALAGTIIYRESAVTNVWDSIAYVPLTAPDVYVDTASNCNQKSYRYYVQRLDTCDGRSSNSGIHKTILLQASLGVSNVVNLSWNNYTGISYNTQYIYRGVSTSSMSLYAQVASNITSYTDTSPIGGTAYYRIAIPKPTGCTSNAGNADTLVYSNMRQNAVSGIYELSALPDWSLSPNPATHTIKVNCGLPYSVVITDMQGRTVLRRTGLHGETTIAVNDLDRGVYMVSIVCERGTGYKRLILD
ncbi:MAG: T9SS type A sorting domain-containing protein [Bacteroidetes bacterium]|nr:T9SS type A sorting domain-containing protein [Bacteroidota bacterium]